MKLVTKYVAVNANISPMDSPQELREFAEKLGIAEPEIIKRELRLLETGDRVTISICRGYHESVDGIVTGGEYYDVTGIFEEISDIIGVLNGEDEDIGRFVQVMQRDMDSWGFPYKNVRLS